MLICFYFLSILYFPSAPLIHDYLSCHSLLRPVDVVTRRSFSVESAIVLVYDFTSLLTHLMPECSCPPFCVLPRFDTYCLHLFRWCLVHSFLGYLIAGHFVLPLLTYTHLGFCTSIWHSMGAAVIPFAFAGRFWIDLGFLVWDWEFGSALLAPGASGILTPENGFGLSARVVVPVWILFGVLFLFICFELRAFFIASFRRSGMIGGNSRL